MVPEAAIEMEVETSANTYEQDEEVIHMQQNNQDQTAVIQSVLTEKIQLDL